MKIRLNKRVFFDFAPNPRWAFIHVIIALVFFLIGYLIK